MPDKRKLMVLGAGPGQLPLIRKALSLGVHVITVDNVPANPGHSRSHASIDCSTVDREGVAAAAIAHGIAGIATFASDVATPTVAFVAAQLGLTGCPLRAAVSMSNKACFRQVQRGFPALASPSFIAGHSFEEIFPAAAALHPPLIFKPADTSGSRGISRVDKPAPSACRKAFDAARNFSRSGVVCVEELIHGTDASGDGFLLTGRLFAVITRKRKRGFVPTGHSLPCDFSEQDQLRIFSEVEANCAAVGYSEGPIDFDVVVTPHRVTVIEMSPRLGGNGIPSIVERATGVDLTTMTLRWALGEPVELPASSTCARPGGSWIFGTPRGGPLRSIASAAEVLAAVPECFECTVNYQPQDIAPPFDHSGNALGSALFDCPSPEAYEDVASKISRALRIAVEQPVPRVMRA
jgi:biotin carboxylase